MNRITHLLPAALALPLLLGVVAAPCGAQQEWATSGNHIHSANSGSVGIGYVPSDLDKYRFGVINPAGGGIVGNGVTGWAGVLGVGQGIGAVGIKGVSSSGRGVYGDSYGGTGVYAYSDGGTGLVAESEYGLALHAKAESGDAGRFDGNVDVNGQLYVTGGLHVGMLSGPFVGVGRSNPITGSEVFGTHGNTSGFSGMYTSTSSSSGKPFYGYAAGGTADAYHYYDGSSNTWRLVVGGGYRLNVTNTGRVGVGTVNPAYTLHVNGSAGKPGGGSWTNTSDRRLKKDIQDLDGSLGKLLSLRGVTYEYKDPDAIHELPGLHTGVIAQEVEQVFPEWVDEGADGFKRVTFRGFEALTVEAMRELEQENQDLRQRLADLEALVASLAANQGEVR